MKVAWPVNSKGWFGRLVLAALLSGGLALGGAAQRAWSQPDAAAALYEKARQSYYQLLRSPQKKQFRHHWLETIGKFQAVVERFPDSYESYKAAFTLGRLYQDLSRVSGNPRDTDQAIHFYRKAVRQYPGKRLSDDALLHLGRIYMKRGDRARAAEIFTRIVEEYPKGDQVARARKNLLSLSRSSPAVTPAATRHETSPPVRLHDLTYENGRRLARVVLKATGPVRFSRERLDNPDRVRLVFHEGQWEEPLPRVVTLKSGILTHVEPRRRPDGKSELLVELTGGGPVSFDLRHSGSRLILEFKAATPPSEKSPLPASPAVVAEGKKTKKKRPVVILDPGHGGKDDGAKGRAGVLEKDINLKIARRVKRILEKRYGYQVGLTRQQDTFIELKDRGDLANQADADLFVSIHANAAPRKSAQGIETYYLGAGSSDRALETAARENGDLVESVEDDDVQQILASLISTTKMNESARLAAAVQKRLVKIMSRKFSHVQDLGVKEGPFYVLHRTNMPSILIEVGFVTNRQEERRLQNATYQYWLAESIAQGIHLFLKEKGPSI